MLYLTQHKTYMKAPPKKHAEAFLNVVNKGINTAVHVLRYNIYSATMLIMTF